MRGQQQQLTVVTLLVAAKGMKPVPEQITANSIVDMLGRLQSVNKYQLKHCQVCIVTAMFGSLCTL